MCSFFFPEESQLPVELTAALTSCKSLLCLTYVWLTENPESNWNGPKKSQLLLFLN